jgi:hypothetical protein
MTHTGAGLAALFGMVLAAAGFPVAVPAGLSRADAQSDRTWPPPTTCCHARVAVLLVPSLADSRRLAFIRCRSSN